MRTSLVIAAAFAAACGGGTTDDAIKIDSITPAFAPLSGGTRIVISGQGFLRDGASPNRVLIGGVEAPEAGAIDDTMLEVETPPGAMPGDAPVIVFNRNGQATAMGMFHYSAPPQIMSASPHVIMSGSAPGMVTVTGSGFSDEDAGPAMLLVDGEPALDLKIVSDTQLTFTPRQTSVVFAPVELDLTNARGTVKAPRAYYYSPTANPSLIVFPRGGQPFYAVLFDTVTMTEYPIPGANNVNLRSVYLGDDGNYWGFDNNFPSQFGRVDFVRGALTDAVPVALHVTSTANFNGKVYMVERNQSEFGTWDATNHKFLPIMPVTNTCGNALVVSNGMLMFSQCPVAPATTPSISPIDPNTGVRGTVVNFTTNHRFTEMRAIGNTLYAKDNGNGLFTIDPVNGTATLVHSFGPSTNFSAMEVFQP